LERIPTLGNRMGCRFTPTAKTFAGVGTYHA
jgi:hypothetical protein